MEGEVIVVATRYIEREGLRMTDVHELEKLPEVVRKIETTGGRLLSVGQVR